MELDALNKKLLKFGGFKRISKPYAKEMGMQAWKYPDGEWDLERDLSNFPEDLTACFKWLVPKIKEQLTLLYIFFDAPYDKQEDWYCRLSSDATGETQMWSACGETPALALCLAIEKVIDEKDSTSS